MAIPPITPAQGVEIFQAVRSVLTSVGVNFQKASNIALNLSEKLQALPSVTPESIKPVVEEIVANAKANGPLYDPPGTAGAGDAALGNAPNAGTGEAAGSSGDAVAVDAAGADAAAADTGAALSDVALVDLAADAAAAAIVV